MTLEQLYCTWAQSGRHGHGMYQTVAKSAGFDHLPAGTLDLALKLCHCDKPATMAERPESFGWIDPAGTRIAFRRSRLPVPRPGQPETFAAHIVAGPVEELQVLAILESFSRGLWWRGVLTDAGPQLPPFNFDSMPGRSTNRPGSIGPAGMRLVEQLLQGRDRVRFQGTPEEAVETLRRVAGSMPGMLEGRTFSTFEYGDCEKWFSIVGDAWPPPREDSDPEVQAAAASLLVRGGPEAWPHEHTGDRRMPASAQGTPRAEQQFPAATGEPGRDIEKDSQGATVAALPDTKEAASKETATSDTAQRTPSLDDPDAVGSLFNNNPEALLAACSSLPQPARQQTACFVINHLRHGTGKLRPEHAPVLEKLISALPLREQTEAWSIILQLGKHLPAEIGPSIDRCVGAYFALMVEDHTLPFSDELTELAGAVPACGRWAALLRAAPTGRLCSIEKALELFPAAEYPLASLVALDLLVYKGPRTPEGLSAARRLGSVGGAAPAVRALRYIRAGYRHAIHRQRPTVLVWAFEQVLQNRDYERPRRERAADRLWTWLTNERHGAQPDSLMTGAGAALEWLSRAAPEQFRALMQTASGIYGPASGRWLVKAAPAVSGHAFPGAATGPVFTDRGTAQPGNGLTSIRREGYGGLPTYGHGSTTRKRDTHGRARRVSGKSHAPSWS